MRAPHMAAHAIAGLVLLAGTTAAANSTTWSIPANNMVCMAGASYAEMTLSSVAGIERVETDPEQRRITASIDERETTIDQVVSALRRVGLEVGEPARLR